MEFIPILRLTGICLKGAYSALHCLSTSNLREVIIKSCFKFLLVEERIPKFFMSKITSHLFGNMVTITMPAVTTWKYSSLTSTTLPSHHQIKLMYTYTDIDYFFVYFNPLQTNYFTFQRIFSCSLIFLPFRSSLYITLSCLPFLSELHTFGTWKCINFSVFLIYWTNIYWEFTIYQHCDRCWEYIWKWN